MGHVIMTAEQDFKPKRYKPNPKAMKPQLKVTVDTDDSLVQEVKVIPPTKQCRVCARFLPATKEYFYGHPGTQDRLESRCKECTKAYKKKLFPVGTAKKSDATPAPAAVEELAPVTAVLQRIDVEARGAEIQRAVATAEIVAAVSLLLGMDRSQSDTVIRMVQAFYTESGVQ